MTTTATDTDSLRLKLAQVSECALRARLSGELVEAAKLQRQAATLHRWLKEVQA